MLRQGSISKGELIERLDLSWATVVKLVNRLERAGIVLRAGTAQREVSVGKNSYLYQVSPINPLAVGVDVEYGHTRLVLTNLRGDTLAERSEPTRPGTTASSFARFLLRVISAFIAEAVAEEATLVGVGIVIPAFIVSSRKNIYTAIQELLAPHLSLPVRVDNVVRAYTLYTAQRFSHPDSFVMVTVRTGIGSGIIAKGELYRGDTGLSGEISHLKVAEGGAQCRCGKSGCLETVVNEHLLCQRYREAFPGSTPPDEETEAGMQETLGALFDAADAGEAKALEIVSESARSLAIGLEALLVTLDISHFYLSGHFGRSGGILAQLIDRHLDELVDKRFVHQVVYRPIDDQGFVMGAAKLMLNDYLEAPHHS